MTFLKTIWLVLLPIYAVYAQTNFIASWNFNSNTGGSSDNPNVAVGGANLVNVQVAGYPAGISIRLWPIGGFDGSKYVEVSVTPQNYQFSVASISFSANRSDQGPTQLSVRSSQDNFSSDIGSATLSTDFSTLTYAINTGNIENTVTFRVYAYNASNILGTLRLNNMRINGTVSLFPLPVEYTYFKGKHYNNQVELSWQTAWERNASHFEVQRSADLKEFTTLQKLIAAGETQQNTNYNFTDFSPLPATNYYRLRQIDKDGSIHLSKNIAVIVQQDEAQIWVFQNPTITSDIRIRLINLEPSDLQLINSHGQRIPFTYYALSNQDYLLKITYQQGVYWLNASHKNKQIVQRILLIE